MIRYLIFIILCGVVVLSEKPSIHGLPLEDGEEVSIEVVPYHASLLYYGWIFICSGTIISDRIILTSAHCIMGNPNQWLVHVGSTHKTEDGQKYAVDKIIIHEEYYNGNNDYDISLFVLHENMMVDGVTTAIIPIVPPHYIIPYDVNEGFSSSWGGTDNENVTDPLKVIHFPILKDSECVKQFENNEAINITDNLMCAGFTKEKCQGDSGAPLTIDCFLVGMLHHPVGCAGKGRPGIWIKISAMSSWLNSWIKQIEEER